MISLTVGALKYVYWSNAERADVPPTVFTVTSIVPAGWLGAMTLSELALLTVTRVAGVAPKSTVVVAVNPVPVMATGVPPEAGPWLGTTEATVGALT